MPNLKYHSGFIRDYSATLKPRSLVYMREGLKYDLGNVAVDDQSESDSGLVDPEGGGLAKVDDLRSEEKEADGG